MEQNPKMIPQLKGDEKRDAIEPLFDGIAIKYDRVNLLISLGQTSRWRKKALKLLSLNQDDQILDAGSGTGMVPFLLKQNNPSLNITGIDLSEEMLQIARNRNPGVPLLKGDVTQLPFDDHTFDCVTTFFTLRNFPDLPSSIAEMFRVLRSGGKLLILDTFSIKCTPIQTLHNIWLKGIAPYLAAPFSDKKPYQYMYESIKHHTTQEKLIELIEQRHGTLVKRQDYTFKFATAMLFEKK